MIPKNLPSDLIRVGNRFPACAKPWHRFVVLFGASAGEGRSEKIMLEEKAGAAWELNEISSRSSPRSREKRDCAETQSSLYLARFAPTSAHSIAPFV
jgi:hypothetical protein